MELRQNNIFSRFLSKVPEDNISESTENKGNRELAAYLSDKLLWNSDNNLHRQVSLERPFMKPLVFSKTLEMKNILSGKSEFIEKMVNWHFGLNGEPIIRGFEGGSLIVHFQITISTKDFFDTP